MRFPLPLLLVVAGLAACGPRVVDSADPCAAATGEGVSVVEAWARPAAKGATSAVYATICNRGTAADALIGASSAAAGAVELHESTRSETGVASMATLARLALPSGGTASLQPGAAHVMLIGLKDAAESDSKISVTFTFEHSPAVTVFADVRPVGEAHSGH